MAHKRPLNVCDACQKQWYPRGQDLADKCARCGSNSVRVATGSEVATTSSRAAGVNIPFDSAPSGNSPVVFPAQVAASVEIAPPVARSGSSFRSLVVLLALSGLGYLGWQYWQEQQMAAPSARSLPTP